MLCESSGFQLRSMTGAVLVALALSAPGKYMKIDWRAIDDSVLPVAICRLMSRCPSNNKKKNVLFLMMGPPTRAPYWFRLSKSFPTPLKLLNQLLASIEEL